MIEMNSILLGTCLLALSVVTCFKTKVISPRKLYAPRLAAVADGGREAVTVLDLKLPYLENEVLLSLVNEEVILKSLIESSCEQFYVCLHLPDGEEVPQLVVFNYISKLYSRIWDEAVQRDKIHLNCIILCDVLTGIAKREDIIMMPEITHFVGFSESILIAANAARVKNGMTPCEINDTNVLSSSLEAKFHSQSEVVLLDASRFAPQQRQNFRYRHVAVGGTFDRLHFGHRKLLTFALSCCIETLTIGITSDEMLAAKSNSAMIADFTVRRSNVTDFMRTIQSKNGVALNILQLTDPFGPTISDPDVDAIIVSSETIRGAFKINEIRAGNGMKPLVILVTYRADASILSSSFLRDRLQHLEESTNGDDYSNS